MLRRIVLADRSREGLVRMADQFVVRPLLSVLRIFPLLRRVGPKAKRDLGLSIGRQVFDLLRLVLLHGAKPANYYLCECYRPGGMAAARAIVMRNEIKHGIGKALNRLDPNALKRRRNLGDKLLAGAWCDEHGFPHAPPLMLVEDGQAKLLRPEAALDRDLFAKRREGRGAYKVTPYRRVAPLRYEDRNGRAVTLRDIVDELLARKPRRAWMIVPQLHNHPELADLSGQSLLTFRALTCLDERMRPVLTNLYLRSLTKLEPQWNVGRLEEYGAPIDLETGRLGQCTGDKPECLSEYFDTHPVTGARVAGREVPRWRELAQLAIDLHRAVPERVFIGWDLALTPEGPMFLEGNSFADLIFPERVFRQAVGDMRLGELLDFHLGRIEAALDRGENPGAEA
ncbi:MAG TPA: sugar-transfer associated ATP-grasp domain-containing protein [Alphaproteobacteria bacterium]|nr:sugar-transfer associated ATP-grasp domain-containing protein [Alphaproteobacteria bacterium]